MGINPQAFGRNVWDGPETISYEQLDGPTTNDKYFQFVPSFTNQTVHTVQYDGTPTLDDCTGGYV